MKNRWMLITLVFSVAINVAVIGTLIFHWSQQNQNDFARQNFRDMDGMEPPRFELALDEAQREEMRTAMQQFRQNIREISDTLRVRRHAMMEMLLSGEDDETVINSIIDETARYQIELERTTVKQLLSMRSILEPEQWQHLVRAIDNNMPNARMRRLEDRPRFGREQRFLDPDTLLPIDQ